jgi:hypothetical protein
MLRPGRVDVESKDGFELEHFVQQHEVGSSFIAASDDGQDA